MLDVLWAIVWGFVVQSKVLEHITRRVVDNFGTRRNAEPVAAPAQPVTIYLDKLPAPPARSTTAIDVDEWLISPIPSRFVLAGDIGDAQCLLGIILDAHAGNPPAISWQAVSMDAAIELTLPANALAAVVATADGHHLTPRKVEAFGTVDGHTVFGLRD